LLRRFFAFAMSSTRHQQRVDRGGYGRGTADEGYHVPVRS